MNIVKVVTIPEIQKYKNFRKRKQVGNEYHQWYKKCILLKRNMCARVCLPFVNFDLGGYLLQNCIACLKIEAENKMTTVG